MKHAALFVALFAIACGETEECRRLADLQRQYETTLLKAQSRAKIVPKLEERLARARTNTDRVLGDLGVDWPAPRLRELLDRRATGVKTASITERDVVLSEGDAEVVRHQFEIRFEEPDPRKAWTTAMELAELPPLFELATLIKEKGKNTWRLQLLEVDADRVNAEPKAHRLEPLDEPETVESNFGFCGASEKRKAIAAVKAQIDQIRGDAEKSTVLLPKIATLDGLLHRTENRKKVEEESRRLMEQMFTAALEAKVPLKAIGWQEPLAIIEVWGGAAERKKLSDRLSSVADKLQNIESPPDVVRLGLPNKQIQVRRPPPVPGGHEGHDHQEGAP